MPSLIRGDKCCYANNKVLKKVKKKYNNGDSLAVAHLTSSPPVRYLNRAERTGSFVGSCSLATTCRKITVFGISPTLIGPKSSI
jgi:hypothetical protein